MCGSEMVGIVTRSNLMRAMVSVARVAPAQASARDDNAIREQLLAIMQKEDWAPLATTNIMVRDGVVELWGVIIDERQREALKVAAENIPGVKAVKDHMAWIEPVSGMTIGAVGDVTAP
jgi:osmotically-inducible protein OsmY